MAIIGQFIWAAGFAVLFGLMLWRRREERDRAGNLCLRYFAARLWLPVFVAFWLVVSIRNLSDPFYQHHPENSYLDFTFLALTILAALFFHSYRWSIVNGSLERHSFLRKPLRYPLSELLSIEQGDTDTTLRLEGDRKVKISNWLSGQVVFWEQVRALTTRSSATSQPRDARLGRA